MTSMSSSLPSMKWQSLNSDGWGDYIHNSFMRAIKYIYYGRIGLTFFLVGWLLVMSYLILYQRFPYRQRGQTLYGLQAQDAQKKPQDQDVNVSIQTMPISSSRFYELHRVWFGDESILWILVKIWYLAILFMMVAPLIKQALTALKSHTK
jgi:hypothetical protein